jgi:hypothetical protein
MDVGRGGWGHHALVEEERSHRLRYENVDLRNGQLQLLHAAVHNVDAGRPAVAVHEPLQQEEGEGACYSARPKRQLEGVTFMSSATSEPSTEYTQAAPAMREKKDRLQRL